MLQFSSLAINIHNYQHICASRITFHRVDSTPRLTPLYALHRNFARTCLCHFHIPQTGLLKSALHSDGKFPTPIVGLQGQPMKTFGSSAITDTTAIAAVFPPVAKPPAFVTIAAKTTDAATTAAAASVNPDEFKKQQRLEQNKMSARRSRRRKKIILEELQATVDHLTAENEQLDAENKRLEKELERRKKEAIRMKDNANGGGLVAAVPPSSLGTGLSTSGGTDMSKATIGYSAVPAIVVPANSIANRSLLVSRLSTIMNGQAAPGLCARSQTLGAPTATTGTLPNLAAASNISSIATPAPRPSQLYLSRPTSDAKNTSSSSSAATAQEQLQRSILSLYQEQERKNTNKKRRLRK